MLGSVLHANNIDLDVTQPIHVEIRIVTSVNKIIIRRQYMILNQSKAGMKKIFLKN